MSIPRCSHSSHRQNSNGKASDVITFKILENAANGDCLFLSIMQFLEHEAIDELPNDASDLRNEIVNYISHSSNWKRFVNTIVFNLEQILPILNKENFSDRFKTGIYKKYMMEPYQYGTFAELQAASEIFDFVYVVFRKEDRRSKEGDYDTWYNCYSSEGHNKFKRKMYLLFSGHPSSGHFRWMRPMFPEKLFAVSQGEYRTVAKYHGTDSSRIFSAEKITYNCRRCRL